MSNLQRNDCQIGFLQICEEFDDARRHLEDGKGIRGTAELTGHSPVTVIRWNRRSEH